MSSKPKLEVRRTYHRDDIIVLEERLKNGVPHGRRRLWHRNGQLAVEENYRHGLLHGVCRQWNQDGKLLGSFEMKQGTGLQRAWHDNGRLNQEFSTVNGRFCGRSRAWLRDGTLLSDRVLLFDCQVTPHQYRLAAAKDPRLPKLRGRIGKPPRRNLALEKHIYRVFVSGLLARRNRSEAGIWLNDGKSARTLGRFKSLGDAAKFVAALYEAGAIKVIAPDIYQNRRRKQFADSLLVQLPKTPAKRKAIRQVCARLSKGNLGAIQPDKDHGESHLYVSMT